MRPPPRQPRPPHFWDQSLSNYDVEVYQEQQAAGVAIGLAWKAVGGTVKEIHGETYTVEDFDGSQMKVHVGQGTKHLRGNKKVGDTIRAEITHGGFANSIQ